MRPSLNILSDELIGQIVDSYLLGTKSPRAMAIEHRLTRLDRTSEAQDRGLAP